MMFHTLVLKSLSKAPTHIQISDITATTVNVSWTRVPNDTQLIKYRFDVTALNGENMFNCTTLGEAHCVLVGLYPDTVYIITVVACSVVTGECSPPSIPSMTARILPEELQQLSMFPGRECQMILKLVKYRFDVTALNGENMFNCTTLGEAHCVLACLYPDTVYIITVVACSVVTGECSSPSIPSMTARTLPEGGTQLSHVAPRSWVLPGGHIPGKRHDQRAKPGEGLRAVCASTPGMSDSRTSHLPPLKKSYGGGDSNPVGGPG
ncbi:unnamed protein product [Schistocephalus solidus]|uniref:Fibronectin type-III domain-containing protein n=1 Tax=Schistocephalus solidus TaxID=70667 RepID=A0A183TIJ9_SCHSO|nr:unnamed protein product [Schistocephalus solidus]